MGGYVLNIHRSVYAHSSGSCEFMTCAYGMCNVACARQSWKYCMIIVSAIFVRLAIIINVIINVAFKSEDVHKHLWQERKSVIFWYYFLDIYAFYEVWGGYHLHNLISNIIALLQVHWSMHWLEHYLNFLLYRVVVTWLVKHELDGKQFFGQVTKAMYIFNFPFKSHDDCALKLHNVKHLLEQQLLHGCKVYKQYPFFYWMAVSFWCLPNLCSTFWQNLYKQDYTCPSSGETP